VKVVPDRVYVMDVKMVPSALVWGRVYPVGKLLKLVVLVVVLYSVFTIVTTVNAVRVRPGPIHWLS